MKKHQNKKEDKEVENKSIQNQSQEEEKTHIENSKGKITELSDEEQEELRAEARERYNRLLGCGG